MNDMPWYMNIFNPELIKAARDAEDKKRQMPKNPVYHKELYPRHMNGGVDAPFCPVCDRILLDDDNDCFDFCPACGQRIDWGDK